MAQSPSIFTRFLCSVGICLSLYALYVEHKTSHPTFTDGIEDGFQALCDIESIGASCSQVFSLPEGRMLTYFGIVPEGSFLDVPNAALGLTYYSVIFLAESHLPKTDLIKLLTVCVNSAAMTSSAFLATKLIQLGELCLLCWTTHLLNLLLLVYYSRVLLKNNADKAKKD
jgi:uncharacterized membrane protein